MILVYTCLLLVASVSYLPMMISVFHLDTPAFYCKTYNLTYESSCPGWVTLKSNFNSEINLGSILTGSPYIQSNSCFQNIIRKSH